MVRCVGKLLLKRSILGLDWEEIHIINVNKGKGDVLSRGNCRGFKLLEFVLKVLECLVVMQIRG